MKYEVGDYVVDNDGILCTITIGRPINNSQWVRPIIPHPELANKWKEKESNLRPAVLSDWAKEIPGEYQDGIGKYWFIIKTNDDYWLLSCEDNKPDGLAEEVVSIPAYMAKAMSVTYHIPIMKEELFNTYRKKKK